MLTFFVTLGLVGASLPAVVASDPSCNKNENPTSMMHHGPGETGYDTVPTTGHFHIWSLVSTAGGSLLKVSQDNTQLDISCSGSFSQSPAEFEDSTVYPTASLSMKFQTSHQKTFYLSINPRDQDVRATGSLQGNRVTDDARLIGWPYKGFVMFESKSHPNHFLGCTKEGVAELFNIHEKRHPDPRTLFVLHNAVPLQ